MKPRLYFDLLFTVVAFRQVQHSDHMKIDKQSDGTFAFRFSNF